MAETIQLQQRREERIPMSAVLTLASWRLRSTWFLLLVIAFGMIVAVIVASALPLFSTVMTTTGLRSTLGATPENTEMTLNTATQEASTSIAYAVQNKFDPLLHSSLGNSIHLEQSILLSEDFSFLPSIPNTTLIAYGTSMEQAAPHLAVVQGRLAHITTTPSDGIEVVMTPASAKRLGLHVGSTFGLSLAYVVAGSQLQQRITAHLVGIVQVKPQDTSYWHGNDFNPFSLVDEAASAAVYQYTLILPYNALLTLFDHVAAQSEPSTVGAVSPSSDGYIFLWYYHFDNSHVTINTLDTIIDRFASLRSIVKSLYGYLQNGVVDVTLAYPYISRVDLSSPLLSTDNNASILEQFRSRIDVLRIPVGVFALLSIALILFFVSLMTSVLIDRQIDTIAILRSRGASRGQIFGALFIQGAILGGIALVLGLPLATLSVFFLAQRVLPASSFNALDVLTSDPLLTTLEMIGYGLGVILVALLTMSISLFFAARMDILALRQEAARSSKQSLWQRFNLDLIAGVVALVVYGVSLYVTSVGNVLTSDAEALVVTPLTIIAPFFLILGCFFLFLRLFPLLLRWGARLAARGRSAVSLLAFAQIARSPRQSLRLVMLLALATAFALFTLVYNATESQHIQDIVNYETGADFSGGLTANGQSLSQVMQQYQSIPGVLSASAGHIEQGNGGTADIPIGINEVDATNFGRTVLWASPQAYQQVRPLLAQLVSARQIISPDDTIPAIVDQAVLQKLLLHVGSTFTVTLNNDTTQALSFSIIGVVDRIPTINDSIVTQQQSKPAPQGAVLVDYQTCVRIVEQHERQNHSHVGPITPPDINQVWLHTKDDMASLANVRTMLNNPQYRVIQLVDRRLLLATLQSDPLYVVLVGVLGLGTTAALLLTLVGDLLTSWLSAYTRLTSFALLRALGITSGQVVRMLTWEQAIVYATSLLLGGGGGILLAVSVIPALTFTNSNSNMSNEQFFALQSALATHLVVPSSLPFLLLILATLYGIALTIMVRVATRSALGQALRLNED